MGEKGARRDTHIVNQPLTYPMSMKDIESLHSLYFLTYYVIMLYHSFSYINSAKLTPYVIITHRQHMYIVHVHVYM